MADNITAPVTSGNFATLEIGGVHHPKGVMTDFSGADVLGLVNDDPATGTLLGRLKAIRDAIVARLPTLGTKTAGESMSVTPSSNGFAVSAPTLEAGRARAVSPASAALSSPARALYVGGAGNVAVTSGGETVTFASVPAGSVLPISVTHVLATGTTATNIVALI